jgi:hypothetical protein
MPALNSHEFSRVLSDQAEQFGEKELEELRMAVGGHYLSAVFLRNLLTSGKHVNLRDIKEEGAASAQKWLVGEVIKNIGDSEKTVLSCVSIFDYEFDLEEAQAAVEEQVFSPFVYLDALCDVGVAHFDGASYHIHETVQPLVYATLAESRRKRLHEKVEKYYRKSLEAQGSKEKGYPYDLIMKWGRHVERLAHCAMYTGRVKEILGLANEQIDAIWSVQRFGSPFNFVDEDDGPGDVTEGDWFRDLVARGFVGKRDGALESTMETFDLLFVIYLCRNRGVSGDLGYISDFRPNIAYAEQGLCCPWEHCIEFMPFPPRSKQEIIEHKKHLQQMFDKDAYADRSPEDVAFLRGMLEAPIPGDAVDRDVDPLQYGGCPIFGHCCPGGHLQAKFCAAQEEADDKAASCP